MNIKMRRKVHTVDSAIVQKHGKGIFFVLKLFQILLLRLSTGLGFCSEKGSATFINVLIYGKDQES